MIVFFTIFFSVYTALNYYIFIRGWQAINSFPLLKPFYAVTFAIVAYGYVLSKLLYKYLSPFLYDIILEIGAIWFAFLVYFILLLVGLDIIRLFESIFHFLPKFIYQNYELTKQITAIIIIFIASVIVVLGNINKKNIQVTTLNLTIPKGNSNLNELNIIMASDVHLSPFDGEDHLKHIVEKINSLNPDIILFAGDVVDDKAEVLIDRKIGESFRKLKSKYGIYAINGNHEFINGVEPCVKYMEDYGFKVLRDEYAFVENNFYVIGREDGAISQFTGKHRKALEDIIINVDNNFPTILLDHTPVKLDQAEKNGIDIQLSGHTHHGQMWPGNIITNMIYEVSRGYKKKSNAHYYVSSGAGTWGPPVRIGSKSEIVNIKLRFSD